MRLEQVENEAGVIGYGTGSLLQDVILQMKTVHCNQLNGQALDFYFAQQLHDFIYI